MRVRYFFIVRNGVLGSLKPSRFSSEFSQYFVFCFDIVDAECQVGNGDFKLQVDLLLLPYLLSEWNQCLFNLSPDV